MIGSLTLTELVCCECITHYAMDNELYKRRVDDGKSFWCPNGHSQVFTESTVDKLKRENQRLKNQASWAETEVEYQKRSHAATKGKLTKLKRRTAHGVCPCCHRTFKQLSQHMENKHPDYKAVVG